ncbi:MAG: nuclear transport factor 2 family protein [Actinobacteria bacterium]|nr:nuclear transport factor 2 family protein [Actinomycetota bacterium]
MAAIEDLSSALEQYHSAAAEFIKGNPQPYKRVFSHQGDVSLANPFGPVVRGWEQATATMERAASLYRDGEIIDFENVATYVTSELAYIVEVERFEIKVGGREEVSTVALRTTSILRPEEGTWKVVHRHADPITTAQPAESVMKR